METDDQHQIDDLIERALVGRRGAGELLGAALEWRTSDESLFNQLMTALARSAAAGSGTATELLLESVHRFGLARPAIASVIRDTDQIDDVAQATLLTLERNIAKYEGRAAFRTWLYTVARNEALMAVRKRVPDPTDQAPDAGGGRFSSVVATRETIEQVLEALPEPYGETLSLQVYEQLDYQQIADRLDVPVGTIRSRLAKARELVATRLGVID